MEIRGSHVGRGYQLFFFNKVANGIGAERTGAFTGIIPNYLQPIDISNLALFLVSDESKNINGAIITADVGWGAV